MKKITSFTHLQTGEGDRIVFTFSELSEYGEIVSQNNKAGFVVFDDEIKSAIKVIEEKIEDFLTKKGA